MSPVQVPPCVRRAALPQQCLSTRRALLPACKKHLLLLPGDCTASAPTCFPFQALDARHGGVSGLPEALRRELTDVENIGGVAHLKGVRACS